MPPDRPLVRPARGPARAASLEVEIARTLAAGSRDEVERSLQPWLGTLWSVGAWLREQHAVPLPGAPGGPGPAPTWRLPPWLPAPHRSSLATWGRLLARGDVRLHGPLGLDRLHRVGPDLVEVDVTPGSGDPAADVGGVVADLLRLEGRSRAAGDAVPRLVAAFTTSYCGLPPSRHLDELALRRAIALRDADRAAVDATPGARDRLRALVEQSWLRVDH